MKDKLLSLIAEAKALRVIKLLLKCVRDEDSKKEITLISARQNALLENSRKGILRLQDSGMEQNAINQSLIEFLDTLSFDLNFSNLLEKALKHDEQEYVGYQKYRNFLNFFNREKSEQAIEISLDSIFKEQNSRRQGSYNIAVIGKTGVGKSSLVNYLFNQEDIVKTGVGKPITARGFHEINFEINGIPATLFDSWGLEVGKADDWLTELYKELEGRDIDKPASEWFHTVLYCIAASSARIEDFELKIINEFIRRKYNIVVVFTKSDLVEEQDIIELKNRIEEVLDRTIVFCEVCSVEKKLRSGKTLKFGR